MILLNNTDASMRCVKNVLMLIVTALVLQYDSAFSFNNNDSIRSRETIDLSFIDFLISYGEHQDALLLLKQYKGNSDAPIIWNDSINYYIGWAYYNIKQLDSSIFYMQRVSKQSSFYLKAKFYEAFEYIYLNRYKEADHKLNTIEIEDNRWEELRLFQQAANALLQRDFMRFDNLSEKFGYTDFTFFSEAQELLQYKTALLKNKKKSPLLAGLMSAVIPGSGKFYAGYRGQAISAAVPSVIFAASAIESYYRSGPKSAQFIAASSIFGLFYLGQIWGSALSVKTFYELKDNEIRNNIMLDLHIPLRRIFSN